MGVTVNPGIDLGNSAAAASRGAESAPRPFWRRGSTRSHEAALIASLNDVASAVSSTLSIDEVLSTIVERAKLVTNTEKAALVLTDDRSAELDLGTLVVRGQRREHPQEEWEARLAGIGARAFATGETVQDVDRTHGTRILASPVKVHTTPIGLVVAINAEDHKFTAEHVNFLAILSAFAASAIENTRLAEQSRYVLLASERDRIAREMHDGIAQSLFSISLALEVCRKQVQRDPAAVSVRLGEVQDQLNMARTELRRFIYDLRPMKLSVLGLEGAIEYWIHEVTAGRSVKGDLVVEGCAPQLSPSQEACLYRVAKEAVSNTVQHSAAREFEVRIVYSPAVVLMAVADNGQGFDTEAYVDGNSGMGLRSIRERVVREGGRLQLVSEAGRGTRLQVELPVGEA